MSLVAGADGEKSVFKDGIQLDHISENTVGHGARVRGVSDPATYPVIAGDVGQKLVFTDRTVTVSGSITWYANFSPLATLTKGVWLIFAYASAAIAGNSFAGSVSTDAITGGTGLITYSAQTGAVVGANHSVTLLGYYVATTDTPIYAKGYIFGTTGSVSMSGFAVRIA